MGRIRRRMVLAGLLALVLGVATAGRARAQGASARLVFDAANLKLNGGNGYKTSSNASGTLAWGESYVMMGYAAMFRGTGDAAYLVTLADHALHVLGRRDSALKLKDYAGRSRPCWQATKYSTGSKPYCWAVHTGMLTYPMADLAWLVSQHPEHKGLPVPGGLTLGQAAQKVLAEVHGSVAVHDAQYKGGPGSGEGHYRGEAGAPVSVAGKALPLNQMTALGRTLAVLAQISAKTVYKQRATALATYLRNRMTKSGASYVWTYWGDSWSSGKGEDISHAAINADFARLCHDLGIVFGAADARRLARTLADNVHQTSDVVADRVDGSGSTGTYRWAVARWLNLAPHDARVWPVAANIYRGTTSTTSGSRLLGLANIARHAPPLREYTFYHVDWSDKGSYKKATAYGANLLVDPPKPGSPCALRIGYRASKPAWVDQWDGKAYHHGHRLAATTGSAFAWAYAPYDPKIYHAYSGTRALLQFTDSFVKGQGIEVKEVPAVVDPTITTTYLPAATVGISYSAKLAGSGDGPLLWSVDSGPTGLQVGLQSGALSWTPAAADAPLTKVTVQLTNDSGSASRTFAVTVQGAGGDAGPPLDGGTGGDGALADHGGASVDGVAPAVDGAGGADAASLPPPTGDGCSCHLPGAHNNVPGAWVLVLVVLFRWASGRRP